MLRQPSRLATKDWIWGVPWVKGYLWALRIVSSTSTIFDGSFPHELIRPPNNTDSVANYLVNVPKAAKVVGFVWIAFSISRGFVKKGDIENGNDETMSEIRMAPIHGAQIRIRQ